MHCDDWADVLSQKYSHICHVSGTHTFVFYSISKAMQAGMNINISFTMLSMCCYVSYMRKCALHLAFWNVRLSPWNSYRRDYLDISVLLVSWMATQLTVFAILYNVHPREWPNGMCDSWSEDMCLRIPDRIYELSEFNARSSTWDFEMFWNWHHSLLNSPATGFYLTSKTCMSYFEYWSAPQSSERIWYRFLLRKMNPVEWLGGGGGVLHHEP